MMYIYLYFVGTFSPFSGVIVLSVIALAVIALGVYLYPKWCIEYAFNMLMWALNYASGHLEVHCSFIYV